MEMALLGYTFTYYNFVYFKNTPYLSGLISSYNSDALQTHSKKVDWRVGEGRKPEQGREGV